MTEAKKTKAKPKSKEAKTQKSAVSEGQVDLLEEEPKTEAKTEVAKAGKRSKKAIKEEAEKVAKQARKTKVKEEEATKPVVKKQVPRVKRYSKNQAAARKLLEVGKLYSIEEAVDLIPKISKVKFDATCEIHVRLGIDPKQADQQFRANVVLPSGSGKSYRVAVLAGEQKSAEAKKAGADIIGADDILANITKSKFDFDVLIAAPDQMVTLGKHAKVLGPKGLMPSPKSGTVTADPALAVSEIKKGRLELRSDANGIVHAGIGKLSFKREDLLSNIKAALITISKNKPSGVKGTYIKSIYLTATMSPSIALDANQAIIDSKK